MAATRRDGVPRQASCPRLLGLLVALVVGSHARSVLAQNASDAAAAEALFDQGKAAMAAHRYSDACPKFHESNRLDEGIGTSLWLAECYEKNGQSASTPIKHTYSCAGKEGVEVSRDGGG